MKTKTITLTPEVEAALVSAHDNAIRTCVRTGMSSAFKMKLVPWDAGRQPDMSELQEAWIQLTELPVHVRAYSERADNEPGAEYMPGYSVDDRAVVSDENYEKLAENSIQYMSAELLIETLTELDIMPTTTFDEEYEKSCQWYVEFRAKQKHEQNKAAASRKDKLEAAREKTAAKFKGRFNSPA